MVDFAGYMEEALLNMFKVTVTKFIVSGHELFKVGGGIYLLTYCGKSGYN